MSPPSDQSSRFSRRYRIHGLVASIAVHTGGVLALICLTYQPRWYDAWLAQQSRTIQVGYSIAAADSDNDPAADEVRIVTDPAEVTKQMIADRIAEVAESADDMSDEEQQNRLGELSERLADVSSEESITAMAGMFQGLFGTAPRATEPAAEPVAGEFDFDSAQFHDIIRTPQEPSGYRYSAVLLDAEGRTLEVEMSEAEGRSLYDTMQQIKQNPLLESVYRQIVMPLLDQMIAGAKQADAATTAPDAPASEP